jgi:Transposase domain (DUF772)
VRGGDDRTGELFSYVDLEARVRRDHPLRTIRAIGNEALSALERDLAALYSPIGRPSIPPEKLLRAMVLQASYSIRSERLLVERLERRRSRPPGPCPENESPSCHGTARRARRSTPRLDQRGLAQRSEWGKNRALSSLSDQIA